MPSRHQKGGKRAANAKVAKSRAARRGSSAQRDPERTRGAILAAATQEFTAKGLSGARVDTIAKRAGVNKRMLYHYFGDKEGLYLAVLEATYAAIRTAEVGLNLRDLGPVDGMRKLVLFTWQYFIDHPEFLSLLGTFKVNPWVAGLATIGVILSAAYALWLCRKIIFGKLERPELANIKDLDYREIICLAPLAVLTIFFGLYPKPVLDLSAASVAQLVENYARALQAVTP